MTTLQAIPQTRTKHGSIYITTTEEERIIKK